MRICSVVLLVLITACSSADDAGAGPESLPVIRVLDGDSLVVDSGQGTEREVRLLGINTPERDECFDGEAQVATESLVGQSVVLEGSDEDRFGRVLAYVFASDGTLVNQELVTTGFALALSTDHRLSDEFKKAEEAAFTAGRGRWQPDACGLPQDGSAVISDLEPNAPGDDAQNKNGEWLEITNTGTERLQLGGWMIQDESSTHRFVFPPDYTLEGEETVRVFSGDGTAEPTRLYWAAQDPVWSNQGDTAYLLDSSGNVKDRLAF